MQGGKFSQIPEWVLDAEISDGAFRLYAALARYADQRTGKAFPSRTTLAKRINKKLSSVDRYLKELQAIGAVTVEARYEEGTSERRSNYYTVATFRPLEVAPQMTPPSPTGGEGVAPQMTRGVAPQMTHITRPTVNETQRNDTGAVEPASLLGQEVAVIQGELVPDEQSKPTAQTLIGEWLQSKSIRPPGRVIGQLSKEIKNLLDEGYEYAHVREAVIAWNSKSLHPATLASVLYETQNKSTAPAGRDNRISETRARGQRLQALRDQQQRNAS
ncbi:helix-turn-helix domain-containing protein [Citricoccus sp.]|uniref:helix-turn-helix domain-containing protein n=1 Tax=Citricoccus sp. TaxID=1978372 RepID=UPI0028BE211C|nr:helix-turn-helix domain-containing protein [Citricoccus sp.]